MTCILTIGNSFAENATRYIPQLLAAAGDSDLVIGKANLGGCSLEKHWNLVEQCAQLPDVNPYWLRYAGDGPEAQQVTLREALAAQTWDFVTLQQVSHDSWRPETYQPHFDNLLALVRECAPGAQPVVHQTWAYRSDALFFEEHGIDQAMMHERLVAAYDAVAAKHGLRIIPSGDAFRRARLQLGFTPDESFDYEHAVPLALPDQSRALITGYHWRTGNTPSGKAELHQDYRHGNALGCYLAGAVWFEMFTGIEASAVPFRPDDISEEELGILHAAAHEAVVENGGPIT
ncbi:MAG: DUF4886 domain-containing protein [Chitinivibrionales bacterium]|nr:DUF4886 domain-containing protein [Chitinivibrionales bacterium]